MHREGGVPSEPSPTEAESNNEDSIVCYCYRLTTGTLKAAYKKHGSLKAVEAATKVGSACTGCKVILQSLFNEVPSDAYNLDQPPSLGTACSKPGHRTMKSFIIANGTVESTVVSSNAVAPQFGDCDSSTEIKYTLLNHRGEPVLSRKQNIKTNETFTFKTVDEDLPRPFYGMFLLELGRQNFGASRFNVYWHNQNGACSTHELDITGRPRVFLPITIDREFLSGPNSIYIAVLNPHQRTMPFKLRVFEPDLGIHINWNSELPALCSTWIDANQFLYSKLLENPEAKRAVLEVSNNTLEPQEAITVYFFIHNRVSDIWSVNHL